MSQIRLLERLSAQDHHSVLGDDFGWPWDIGVLAIVEGTRLLDGHGQVRIDEVRRRVEPKLHLLPHFRQVLYRPTLGLGWPLWVDAQSFDLADHIRVLSLPASAGEAQLLEACEKLRRQRLDMTRPPWEMWLLPGLPERRVGLYLRMHHAMADGIAGVAVIGALLDPSADPPVPVAPPWTPAAMPSARDLLRDNMQWRIQGLHGLLPRLAHPVSTLRQAQSAWPAWRELWAEERAPRTSLNRPVGRHRSLTLIRTRLDLAKRIAHAHDAKVNDIVLAAVGGGLRELLTSRGEPVEALVLRAMVPVSLHHEQPGQARGNLDGMMIVPLPLGDPDPLQVLERVAVETLDRKKKARPQAMTTGIFRLALARRAIARLAKHQWLLNLAVSNVPGPPVPLYLAGAQLLEIFPVVPLVGNQTLNVGVLSYAGQLNLTAVADGDACPDIDIFAQGVRNTLSKLARSVVATT